MSEWQYTIRVGYGDEHDKWVAQITDDQGEELHGLLALLIVVTADTVGEVVGQAAVAIMDVHEEEAR